MAKAYSDDLRRKILVAYDRELGSLRELAERFCVSYAWARKKVLPVWRNLLGRLSAMIVT